MNLKKHILVLILIIVTLSMSACTNERDSIEYSKTSDSINLFFFPSGENSKSYDGKFDTLVDSWLFTTVNCLIIDLGQYYNGNLYNIKIELEGSELKDNLIPGDFEYHARLNLGYFYLEEDKIYKFDATVENIAIFEEGNTLPEEGYITCQYEELKDPLDETVKGWHHYIEVEGDKRRSGFYNNTVETGYYETIIWEKGIGMVKYSSGYGAGRRLIELELVRD